MNYEYCLYKKCCRHSYNIEFIVLVLELIDLSGLITGIREKDDSTSEIMDCSCGCSENCTMHNKMALLRTREAKSVIIHEP